MAAQRKAAIFVSVLAGLDRHPESQGYSESEDEDDTSGERMLWRCERQEERCHTVRKCGKRAKKLFQRDDGRPGGSTKRRNPLKRVIVSLNQHGMAALVCQ